MVCWKLILRMTYLCFCYAEHFCLRLNLSKNTAETASNDVISGGIPISIYAIRFFVCAYKLSIIFLLRV